MYNLKRGRGTYKGLIGECLFKLTRRYLIVTNFFNKKKYMRIFGEKLNLEERNFLDKNWFSIDAIEFDYSKSPRKVVLFEIKTLNDFYYVKLNGLNRIPTLTKNTSEMYREALEKGFDVKVAIIWLKENWDYDVEIIDFNKCKFFIDKSKKYDKK